MDLDTERKPHFVPTQTRHIVGCDLGQAADFTAISVLEHCHGITDHGSDYERHTGQTKGLGLQTKAQRFRVVHLERLPLGTSYNRVVQHVVSMLARPPLCGEAGNLHSKPAAELVLDSGGVGRGVADYFVAAGCKPIQVQITAGADVKYDRGRYNVSKHSLITGLDALLHHPDHPLKFSKHLLEADAFKEELRDFERHVGNAGRHTYAARTGRHDDLVLSVALAAWWASRPPPAVAQFGRYGYADPGSGNVFTYGTNI